MLKPNTLYRISAEQLLWTLGGFAEQEAEPTDRRAYSLCQSRTLDEIARTYPDKVPDGLPEMYSRLWGRTENAISTQICHRRRKHQ